MVSLLGFPGDEETRVADYSNKLKAGKTYYIRVEHTGAYTATVKYSLSLIKYDTDDYPSKLTAEENVIDLNKETKGIGNSNVDVDYFSFVTDDNASYYKFTIKTNKIEDDPSENGRATVYICSDPDTTENLSSITNLPQGEAYSVDLGKLSPKTKYYVKVIFCEIDKYKTIGYSLIPEVYSVDDVADTIDQATAFKLNESTVGYISQANCLDYYSFTTDSSNSFYSFDFAAYSEGGAEGNVLYEMYADKEMTKRISDGKVYMDGSVSKDFAKTLEKNHTYYIKVYTYEKKQFVDTKYTLKVNQINDDVEDDGKKASTVTVNTPVSKKLQHTTDEDAFKVTTTSYTKYTLTFKNTSKTGNCKVTVYKDKDCTKKLAEYTQGAKSALTAKEGALTLTAYKTYYIKVTGDADVNYTVGLNATAPTTTAKKVSKQLQVKVTWNQVKNAQGYEVWRSVGGGKYVKVTTIKNAKTLTYTDKKVSKNKTYKYKIRAYAKKSGKTYYSAYSAEKTVKVTK